MASVSKEAQEFIKGFEGLRLTAYQDAGGIWTIGYGHTGPNVHEGQTINQLTADALFLQDLASAAEAVENLLDHPATPGQYGALVSFAYNVGIEAFRTSTLRQKFNTGDVAGTAKEFGEWIFVGKEILQGLVRRRVAEIVLFLT